jgi:GDP-L-fucose synthase
MKQKILICGATGFIGRNMLESFIKNDNYEIRATWHKPTDLTEVYRDDVEWVQADLTKSWDVKNAFYGGVDIVLQYAAVTTGVKDVINRPYIHVTDNAIMNSLLLREAFEQKVKHFIFPSCTVMYQSGDIPVKESDFNESEELYSKYYGGGNTKVYIEKMCKFYSTLGETKFTVLRQSNIYGPYDKFSLEIGHVFAATIVKVVQANDSIDVWGTGKEERDLLYVSDLVNSVQSVLENQTSKFELVNVGCGKSISVLDLVKKIVDISGKKLSINYDKDKPSVDTKLAVNIDKIKRLFNWSPDITLETGIKNTLKWYRENRV